MKKLICAIVFMTALAAAALQAAPTTRATLSRLSLGMGLSNSYVTDIAEDKRGLMWVATEDGLNIFDGSRFISIFKTADSSLPGISGNELNTLLDDPQDSVMWIGTQRAGINAFDYRTGEFVEFRHNDADPASLVTDDVTKIVPTTGGDLLIATYWKGVDRMDTKTGHFTHFNSSNVEGMDEGNLWTVADGGNDDIIYVGYNCGGLGVVSMNSRTATVFRHDPSDNNSLPGNTVRSILPYNAKEVLVGTDRGLALFDSSTRTFRRPKDAVLRNATIFDMRLLDGEVWIATEFNGIMILDMTRGFDNAVTRRPATVADQIEAPVLNCSTVRTLARDRYGNIWAGTWGSGVDFLTSEKPLFASFGTAPGRPDEFSMTHRTAACIVTDKDSNLWVGTDGGGINVFADGRCVQRYTDLAGHSEANHLQAAARDNRDNLWFGAFNGGLFFYDWHRRAFSKVPIGDSDVDVRDIIVSGDTIYAVSSEGVYCIDAQTRRVAGYIDVGMARSMTIDRRGRRWVGTFGSGMMVYGPHNDFIRFYNVAGGFPSNTVNDICLDSRNRLWVATGEGLVKFDTPDDTTYTVYGRGHGLSNSFASAIIEDFDGNIWVSTNNGISYVSGDSILSFSYLDNLPIGSFMRGSTDASPGGTISFGALNGLCRFDPREVLKPCACPEPIITEFAALGPGERSRALSTLGQLDTEREYSLSHNENTLSFTANTGNYALSRRVEYSFRLAGFDKGWFSNGTNNIVYRNVPPGRYTFEVRARIRNQEWSEALTSVKIVIKPPLWLTWWAKTIYILLALGIIAFVLYMANRRFKAEALYQLEKKQRLQERELTDERLRFYTNVTHELRTPLSLITGPLEDTLRQNTLNERDRQKLTVIHRNAEKLTGLVNQVLEFRKSETSHKRLCIRRQDISSTVYETALKYKELINDPRIRINIGSHPENIEIPHDKEAVMMILDNLISNALKYTVKGRIDICSELKKDDSGRDYVEISVSDTGYGISPDVLPRIFDRYYQERGPHQASGTGIGLALVKNLTELHHGTIDVESKLNEGTTFRLRLWADEEYPEAIHPDDYPAPGTEGTPSPARENEVLDRKRPLVLVVEDNQDLREYIADSFTDLYEVRSAADGRTGLELARAISPDIIITDVMMPVMDGLEMCRALKSDILTSHIPVIILTAKDTEPDREDGYAAGADSYLTKPFSSHLLLSRVDNIFRSRSRMAGANVPATTPTQPDGTETMPEQQPEFAAIDCDFLTRLRISVEENISSETVDVAFLADCLCMSRATLYRKVKALTGIAPNEYIRKMRMQIAARLLAEGKLTISEISFKVGINSTPYFRQCFREEFGVNPSDYMKKGGR